MPDKAPLVKQPGLMPSRKLIAGALAGLFTTIITQYAAEFAAIPRLAWLESPSFQTLVPLLAMAGAAYLIRDRSNNGAPDA